MSADAKARTTPAAAGATSLESVNRISHLPVVESTIELATGIYNKVKDSNSMVHWTLDKAETTAQTAVNVAVEAGRPVAAALQGPIQRVDSALCSGIDYVESKIPAVKLQPQQMYDQSKQFVVDAVQPVVATVCSVCGYGLQKMNEVGQTIIGKTTGHADNDATNSDTPCAQCREDRRRREEQHKAEKAAMQNQNQQ